MEYLRRGFSQNKKGKDPIGFSRKAKAKRKLSTIFLGLKPMLKNIAVHDLKGRGNLNSRRRSFDTPSSARGELVQNVRGVSTPLQG